MGCHDAPMSDVVDESDARRRPARERSMRLAGFGLTALGGLLIGVGALLPWIRSSLEGLPDEFSPTYYGIDLPDGIDRARGRGGRARRARDHAARDRRRRARRLAAGAVIAASVVAIAVGGRERC